MDLRLKNTLNIDRVIFEYFASFYPEIKFFDDFIFDEVSREVYFTYTIGDSEARQLRFKLNIAPKNINCQVTEGDGDYSLMLKQFDDFNYYFDSGLSNDSQHDDLGRIELCVLFYAYLKYEGLMQNNCVFCDYIPSFYYVLSRSILKFHDDSPSLIDVFSMDDDYTSSFGYLSPDFYFCAVILPRVITNVEKDTVEINVGVELLMPDLRRTNVLMTYVLKDEDEMYEHYESINYLGGFLSVLTPTNIVIKINDTIDFDLGSNAEAGYVKSQLSSILSIASSIGYLKWEGETYLTENVGVSDYGLALWALGSYYVLNNDELGLNFNRDLASRLSDLKCDFAVRDLFFDLEFQIKERIENDANFNQYISDNAHKNKMAGYCEIETESLTCLGFYVVDGNLVLDFNLTGYLEVYESISERFMYKEPLDLYFKLFFSVDNDELSLSCDVINEDGTPSGIRPFYLRAQIVAGVGLVIPKLEESTWIDKLVRFYCDYSYLLFDRGFDVYTPEAIYGDSCRFVDFAEIGINSDLVRKTYGLESDDSVARCFTAQVDGIFDEDGVDAFLDLKYQFCQKKAKVTKIEVDCYHYSVLEDLLIYLDVEGDADRLLCKYIRSLILEDIRLTYGIDYRLKKDNDIFNSLQSLLLDINGCN